MGILDDAIREHLELKRRHGADASEIARQEREALGPVVRGELDIPDPGEAQPAFDAAPGGAVTVDEPPFDDEPSFFEKPVERPRAAAAPLEPPPVAPAPAAAVPVPPAADAGQHTVAFSLDELEAAAAVEDARAADAPAPTPATPPAAGEPPAAAPPVTPPPATAAQPPAPTAPPATERPRAAPAPPPDVPPAAPSLDRPVEDLTWDAPPADEAVPREVAPDVVPADAEPGEHDELEETPEFLQETPEHDRLWFEQRPPRDFDF